MSTVPGAPCSVIRVLAFRGDRNAAYWKMLEQKMDDEDNQQGPGPTDSDVLLWAGHSGVSLDRGVTVYGFNPVKGTFTTRQLLNHLKQHYAVPGEVRNDTAIFADARQNGLPVDEIDILVPKACYDEVAKALAAERNSSNYTYGFPDGDGDCNCATWMERIGVPLLTGKMDELLLTLNFSIHHLGLQRRRFGHCTPSPWSKP